MAELKVVGLNKNQPAMDADHVLKESIGNYESVLVVGYDKDGSMDVRASLNLDHKSILFLLEHFKLKLLSGNYKDE